MLFEIQFKPFLWKMRIWKCFFAKFPIYTGLNISPQYKGMLLVHSNVYFIWTSQLPNSPNIDDHLLCVAYMILLAAYRTDTADPSCWFFYRYTYTVLTISHNLEDEESAGNSTASIYRLVSSIAQPSIEADAQQFLSNILLWNVHM